MHSFNFFSSRRKICFPQRSPRRRIFLTFVESRRFFLQIAISLSSVKLSPFAQNPVFLFRTCFDFFLLSACLRLCLRNCFFSPRPFPSLSTQPFPENHLCVLFVAVSLPRLQPVFSFLYLSFFPSFFLLFPHSCSPLPSAFPSLSLARFLSLRSKELPFPRPSKQAALPAPGAAASLAAETWI